VCVGGGGAARQRGSAAARQRGSQAARQPGSQAVRRETPGEPRPPRAPPGLRAVSGRSVCWEAVSLVERSRRNQSVCAGRQWGGGGTSTFTFHPAHFTLQWHRPTTHPT
jgi:hypothetical protein